MKIHFLGRDYPIVTISFGNHGVSVAYFDERSPLPGIQIVMLTHKEFSQTCSVLGVML